jgi:hypothetical protein
MEAVRTYHTANGPLLTIAVPEALQHARIEVIVLPAEEAQVVEEPVAAYALTETPTLSPEKIQRMNAEVSARLDGMTREEILAEVIAYAGSTVSPFGDVMEWQREIRKDRVLPFRED